MSRVSQGTCNQKMPDELIELYRLVLVDGVMIESFKKNGIINIWTVDAKNRAQQYWVEFTSRGPNFILRPVRFNGFGGVSIKEVLGVGILNPRPDG